jgi:hypothetical protein
MDNPADFVRLGGYANAAINRAAKALALTGFDVQTRQI